VHAIFRHDYPLAVEPASTPRPLVQKKTLRDSLPLDMLLSAFSVLVVAQSSSEVPEGLMNNPVLGTTDPLTQGNIPEGLHLLMTTSQHWYKIKETHTRAHMHTHTLLQNNYVQICNNLHHST